MKTVREHLRDKGYDIEKALNRKWIEDNYGTMECDKIQLKERVIDDSYEGKKVKVEAVAIVPYSDGSNRPYPTIGGWSKALEASLTLYFKAD